MLKLILIVIAVFILGMIVGEATKPAPLPQGHIIKYDIAPVG